MNICESWLREWVNPALTTKEISTQLTMLGLEVDSVNPVAGEFNKVIVAKVIDTRKHPEADKLTLCDVDNGETTLQIVCGAANVRKGLMVALATVGAKLPGGMKIKKSKLRGEESLGMLCSATELGLDDKCDGILELPDDAPIGIDIREYLLLNDNVFDIDLTPNRADCLSILGVAREIAAKNNLPLKDIPQDKSLVSIQDVRDVNLVASKACPQYAGRIVTGININAITPLWMKERLRRGGIRPLHTVVDIMNYVMLEIGQPMHAFDLSSINGKITVRFAEKDEEIELLNGQNIKLSEDVLVIADDKTPLAMAGIMGGDESSVKDLTTDIFLESAYFNPVTMANIARRYGLNSDASQRYERGVDPSLQVQALERATCLILEIAGGSAGPVQFVSEPTHLPKFSDVKFNPEKVLRLTGVEVDTDSMQQMLESLGMGVSKDENEWVVSVPTHRFDISLDVDLVEEIIRLYGFDNIPNDTLKTLLQKGNANNSESLVLQLRHKLVDRGYFETISYSFVDPSLQEELYPNLKALKLVNPISEELSVMRVGMWSGLLASMIHNLNRQQSGIKLFEAGDVFQKIDGKLSEQQCLAGLITGEYGALNWGEVNGKYDFYDMKGDIQSLFSSMHHHDLVFKKTEHEALHPGKSAKIYIGSKEVGIIGVLHPRFMDAFDITDEVMLFEISLSAIVKESRVTYQPISKYPQTRRDLSLLVDDNVSAMQIEDVVRSVIEPSWMKSFDIFDVYIGDSIPENKKSLAISLTLQNDSRTLIDEEINDIMDKILDKLAKDYAVELRSLG
ncbi:MAG: phenylalanine--tRNA ligase subunit beta [Legionellaceae bacterium]|nr:phenylalanine--tRNA ligase subunit beta [Legionellaceae bacterium]